MRAAGEPAEVGRHEGMGSGTTLERVCGEEGHLFSKLSGMNKVRRRLERIDEGITRYLLQLKAED
jgi:hypothetical protein